MSYNVSAFSDYVARENATLTKTLFAGGDTAKVATKMSGVKGSTEVPHLSGAATLQAGNCPTPSGSRVASLVTLTVKPFTVYEDFCQADLETKFPNMVVGSNNGDSLAPWQEVLIDTIISSINEQLELHYWQGDTGGTYTLFDGFIKQIDAAGDAINGNPSGITSVTGIVDANVIDIVEGMYTNHTDAKVKRDKSFVILAGDDVFDLYIKALKAANLYHYAPEHDNGEIKIGGSGVTLVRVYGLDGTDRLFSSVGRNFVIGADADGEENIADVFYDKKEDKMYVRVKGKAGVTISNSDEIAEFTLV